MTPEFKTVAEVGVIAVLSYLVLIGARALIPALTKERQAHRDEMHAVYTQLVQVVQNNTEALTRLCGQSLETKAALAQHDEHVSTIHDEISQIGVDVRDVKIKTTRIEAKVDEHGKELQRLRGKD